MGRGGLRFPSPGSRSPARASGSLVLCDYSNSKGASGAVGCIPNEDSGQVVFRPLLCWSGNVSFTDFRDPGTSTDLNQVLCMTPWPSRFGAGAWSLLGNPLDLQLLSGCSSGALSMLDCQGQMGLPALLDKKLGHGLPT